ncbi:MAG: LysO family transporter [Odoribacter sp.]
MLKIVGIMLCGVLTGYLLRNKEMGWVSKLITLAIWLLLFLLGIVVGVNDQIMDNLLTIGWQALILALGAVLGSVILARVVYSFWFQEQKKGEGNEG